MKQVYILASLLCVSPFAFADDLAPTRTETGKINVEKDYHLEVDAGYLFNQSKSEGNTSDKENLTARILYQRERGVWGQEFLATAVSSNDSDSTDNIERYLVSGKVLHRSSDTVYQFGRLVGEKDLSSPYDYQISATAGVGKDVIKNERQSLSVELGAGYRYSKQRYAPYDADNELIGTIAGFYEYQITPSLQFNQDLSYEYGADSRTLRSRTALSADVSKNIAATASYLIKDLNSDIGDSRDSLLSLGLRYNY